MARHPQPFPAGAAAVPGIPRRPGSPERGVRRIRLPGWGLLAALFLGQAAPAAVHLPGPQRERETLPPDQATGADRLRLGHLPQGLTGGRDEEEQTGIGRFTVAAITLTR